MRKGISPVIATVIIVAVAIAISIAVAGWLMGLWGGFGQTESLKVMPTSTLEKSNSNWILTVNIRNTGSKDSVVTKIELVGVGSSSTMTVTPPGSTTTATVTEYTIKQGESATITINFTGVNITPGTQYLVKVYTADGNVFQGYVTAQG